MVKYLTAVMFVRMYFSMFWFKKVGGKDLHAGENTLGLISKLLIRF